MKKCIIISMLVGSFMLFQGVGAEERSGSEDTEPVKKVRIPEVFDTRQIKDWKVIDNKTIIIDTYSYGKYKATFMQPCQNIPFTETLGFLTQGPYVLDEYTTVILSNGETCKIKELVPYEEEE